MAVAYGSIANSTLWQLSNSAVVTKPSGLAVGDIMIAYSASSAAVTFPSGFTSIGSTSAGGNNYATYLGYKVADSSDVAATDFTFTIATGTNTCVLIRVTGASTGTSTIISSGDLVSNTSTPSITGITPYNRGDALLFQLWHGSDGIASTGSYAIATSNPSWNEVLDVSNGTTGIGIAWASRTQLTATGNFSVSSGNGTTDWGGWIISFAPSLSASVSDSMTMTESRLGKVTMTKTESITMTDSVVGLAQRVWSTISKNISTWINQDKS